jgi:hypothetical protein
MTHTNNLTTKPIHPTSLVKLMLLGAAFALIVITIFLLGVKDPNPAWGKLWMVKPLIMVPLAGAMGGLFYYFMGMVLNQGGWKKVLAIVLGLIGYIIALWLGTVLGLNGTLWD